MNRDADVENFWNLIEREINIIFPTYLRNILKLRGYDNAVSVKGITEEDIEKNFETFAKTSMKERIPKNSNVEDYYSIYDGPDDFEIGPGHKILLREVVEHVKEMTSLHGKNYFNFYTLPVEPSKPFIKKRALRLSTQSGSEMSSANNENVEESYLKQEQYNLFKKIKAWLKKHADNATENYSENIQMDMVELKFGVDVETNIQKLEASVTCFICDRKVVISDMRKVLADGSFQTYFVASNFNKHIKNHLEKNEMRRVRHMDDKSSETESKKSLPHKTGAEKHKKILNRILAQKHERTESVLSERERNQLAPYDSDTAILRSATNTVRETIHIDHDVDNDPSNDDSCEEFDFQFSSKGVSITNPFHEGPQTFAAQAKDERTCKNATNKKSAQGLHAESDSQGNSSNEPHPVITRVRDAVKQPFVNIVEKAIYLNQDMDNSSDSSSSQQEAILSNPPLEEPHTTVVKTYSAADSDLESHDSDNNGNLLRQSSKKTFKKTLPYPVKAKPHTSSTQVNDNSSLYRVARTDGYSEPVFNLKRKFSKTANSKQQPDSNIALKTTISKKKRLSNNQTEDNNDHVFQETGSNRPPCNLNKKTKIDKTTDNTNKENIGGNMIETGNQIESSNDYETKDEDEDDEIAATKESITNSGFRVDNIHKFQVTHEKGKKELQGKQSNSKNKSKKQHYDEAASLTSVDSSSKTKNKFKIRKRRSNLRPLAMINKGETVEEYTKGNLQRPKSKSGSISIGDGEGVTFSKEFLCAECGNKNKTFGAKIHDNINGQMQLTQYSDIANDTNGENANEHVILKALLNSAVKNAPRKKCGYRHSDIIKMFAGFIKMVGGLLAYETLHANLPLSLPSPSTVDRFIKDNGPSIIEGVPRIAELVEYLNLRNLPFRVSLSEDATRITAKVSYDPNTNQLVGFALPLDDNSMPIPFSFKARNAKEIESHFKNPLNTIPSLVYVQMIQPQAQNVSPFCLNLFLSNNDFTAECVQKRWTFLKRELQKKKINIDSFASDGDPRYLKAMKVKSKIGVHDETFLNCIWFSCGKSLNETYLQDPTHVGTKLRCRVLKKSRITPIGRKLISTSHLQYLIDNISKDKHLLTQYDIEPKDRQNFDSVEKISSLKTINCMLEFVPGSEGTAMYLKAMNYALYPYLDPGMKLKDRIYKIWYSVFFFRIWRSFIIQKSVPKSSATLMVKYTLKECFISSNCYTCLELNAHTLIKQIMKCNVEKPNNGADKLFIPNLLDSQPCESIFRLIRSFTSTFCTIVNCTMVEIIHRIRKIQLQYDIINCSSWKIKFPRFQKKKDGTHPIEPHFITKDDIISEIERAKSDISNDLVTLGVFKKSEIESLNFRCQIKAETKARLQNEIDLCDYDSDSDSLSDSDNECETEPNQSHQNRSITIDDYCNYEIELEEDMHKISNLTGELSMRDYSETKLNLKEDSPFTIVVDSTGKESVVRKSSICWLLSKDKYKLSSDRLQRVKEKEFDMNTSVYNQNQSLTSALASASLLLKKNEIHIGDWCVFEANNNLRLGLVLSFSYLTGNTLKGREYTKSFAPVLAPGNSTITKSIGVLCSWYNWDSRGSLNGITEMKHDFLKIENYQGTITKPSYINQNLSIPYDLIKILDDVKRTKDNSQKKRINVECQNDSSIQIIQKSLTETPISILDYVICSFETVCNKTLRYFVGQVRSIAEVTPEANTHRKDENLHTKEFEIKFLRKSGDTFVYPTVEDVAYVSLKNIIHVLKEPSITRRNAVTFNDPEINNFFQLNLCRL